MAKTITIREISKEDNKMLKELAEFTQEKTASKNLLKAGHLCLSVYKEKTVLEKNHETNQKQIEELQTAIKDFVNSFSNLDSISKQI